MSISRILNKTVLQNERSNVYEVTINDDLIQSILQSRFVGEGIFTLEQFSLADYTEQYFTSPSFNKFDYPTTNKEWQFDNDAIIYELILEKAYFLPLDIKQHINLFQFLSQLDATLFSQLLITKRQDNWRDTAIDLYYSYLDGVDFPISNKAIRGVQAKVLNVLNKVSNYNVKRDEIEEIEQKILQTGYRVECRIVLLDPKNQQKFEENVRKQLQKLNLFNEIVLKRVKNSKNLRNEIKNRSFQSDLIGNLLSQKELISLVAEREMTTSATIVPTVVPVKRGVVQRLEESQLLKHAISLLPYEKSKQREVDQTLPKRINGAFVRVGITKKEFKIVETLQGASLLKVQFLVPPDLVFTQIKKKLEDIQGALGNRNVSIEIGEKPDTINVYMPLDEREVVYFRGVLESEEFQTFCKNNPLPFIIGESVDGGLMFACLTKLRHLLISGTSGSGKSVFMTLVLLTFLLTVPSDELDMYLIDPKMVELSMFKGFPQVRPIITDMKKAVTLLDQLCIEMDNRYELMSKVGAKEIGTYNQKSDTKIPYIVCAIDELSDLIMTNGDVEDFIVRIAQKGRASGIHLILATQRPSVDVVTGLIKANMPARIAFKTTSGVDSKTILDTVGAEKLLGLGDGLCRIEGSPRELERFQAPVLTLVKEDEERIYDELKKLFKDLPCAESELAEVEPEEEPIDKLKRIIANVNELRISELQKMMGIGINKVTELMKQLVEEGWLNKEGRSYVVAVDVDEINRWRDE